MLHLDARVLNTICTTVAAHYVCQLNLSTAVLTSYHTDTTKGSLKLLNVLDVNVLTSYIPHHCRSGPILWQGSENNGTGLIEQREN